jgi:hypothetical protein
MQALASLDPLKARRIVNVLDSVFAIALRQWSQGRITMRELHEQVDSAVDLLVP